MPSNETTAEASVWIDASIEAALARVANMASFAYRLSPERGGTRLTESFESPILAGRPAEMSPTRRQTLVETLATITADIESC